MVTALLTNIVVESIKVAAVNMASQQALTKSVCRSNPGSSPTNQIVPKPLPTDVLFGRDKIMFNHVGNVRFRALIQGRAKEYEFAPQRRIKSSIVYEVVECVHAYGGRFLKPENGTWKIVSVNEAIQKVSYYHLALNHIHQK